MQRINNVLLVEPCPLASVDYVALVHLLVEVPYRV